MASGAGSADGNVVVVTGATGYIASHIVKGLLADGRFTVRATVRDPSNEKKTKFLRDLPGASDRLKFYKADLLVPGSFDAAINGAHYVIHTASPVPLELSDDPYTQVVAPAVEGTRNVFDSITKAASVRRVVVTSSIRAVFGFGNEKPQGYVYGEDDWNETSTLENNQAYSLSKTLAELVVPVSKLTYQRLAWEYANKQSRYDLVAIHPGLVFGPSLSGTEDSMSITLFKNLVTGEPIVHMEWGVVDVRDVAKAHVAAVTNPKAKGRYMCNSKTMSFLDIVNTVRDKVRRRLLWFHVPKPALWLGYYSGYTGKQLAYEDIAYNVGYAVHFNTERVQQDLLPDGFIDPKQTFSDMYDNLVAAKIIPEGN